MNDASSSKLGHESSAASLATGESDPEHLVPGKAGTLGLRSDAGRTAADLRPLADQLVEIAQKLRSGAFELSPIRSNLQPPTTSAASVAAQSFPRHSNPGEQRLAFAEMARIAYSTRRRRAAIFGNPEMFGEPAWDILLDLYIAHAEGKPVSVSSACIGSAAPPTTGLRWLGVLAEHDLVLREHDPDDQRRVLVRLTGRGLAAMDEYFAMAGPAA